MTAPMPVQRPRAPRRLGLFLPLAALAALPAGATLVVNSLGDFATIFQHAFGIKGVVPNNEAIVSIAQ